MSFLEAVKICLGRRYFDFRGRACRAEFWFFMLFCVLLDIFFRLIPLEFLIYAVNVLLLVPSISVWVRRLHDLNLSGFWALIPIAATVSGLVLGAHLTEESLESDFIKNVLMVAGILGMVYMGMLVLFIKRGTIGDNAYGPDPLEKQKEGSVKTSMLA